MIQVLDALKRLTNTSPKHNGLYSKCQEKLTLLSNLTCIETLDNLLLLKTTWKKLKDNLQKM